MNDRVSKRQKGTSMKKTTLLLLAAALAFMLAACGVPGNSPVSGDENAKDAESAIAVLPADYEVFDPESLLYSKSVDYANDYEAYMALLDGMHRQGLYFDTLGLKRQAAYLYSAGAASAGALRLCIENLLFLKNEGDSLANVIAGRYGDWDSLARLSPVSPYPDYFEGLVYQAQGRVDEATACFERAVLFPSWPEAGWDFTYLKMLEVSELYALRDALLKTENAFYAAFTPELIPISREQYSFSAEYLMARAMEEADTIDIAYRYAIAAVCADPFSGDTYGGAAAFALLAGDADTAREYINDGLLIDPENEGLNMLLQAYSSQLQEVQE